MAVAFQLELDGCGVFSSAPHVPSSFSPTNFSQRRFQCPLSSFMAPLLFVYDFQDFQNIRFLFLMVYEKLDSIFLCPPFLDLYNLPSLPSQTSSPSPFSPYRFSLARSSFSSYFLFFEVQIFVGFVFSGSGFRFLDKNPKPVSIISWYPQFPRGNFNFLSYPSFPGNNFFSILMCNNLILMFEIHVSDSQWNPTFWVYDKFHTFSQDPLSSILLRCVSLLVLLHFMIFLLPVSS